MADISNFDIEAPSNVISVGDMKKLTSRLATAWGSQSSKYEEWWSWISGEKLRETDGVKAKDGKSKLIAKYPLEINPALWIAQKHGEILWGEVPDDAGNMVNFSYRAEDRTQPAELEVIADIVNRVWFDSHPRDVLSQAGFLSQFLGGAVLGISRSDSTKYGLRISNVIPDFFLPVFDSTDPWNLLESWRCFYITPEEAAENYGVKISADKDKCVLSEQWTRDYYEILVDGKPPTRMFGLEGYKSAGENPIGRVPYVYIPHYLRTADHYGMSQIPGIAKLMLELNSRTADAGDYVRENSGTEYVLKNTTVAPKALILPNGKQAIDIGKPQVGSNLDPDLSRMQTSSVNGDIHQKLPRQIMEMIQRDGATPNITWGEDEGSQRSAITLAFKMWPLTSHIRKERAMWAEGFRQLNDIIVRWLGVLKTNNLPENAADYLSFTKWEPMTPRDRLDLVNEVVTLYSVHLLSQKRAVQLLNRGEDVAEELAEIKKDMEEAQKSLGNSQGSPAGAIISNGAANSISQQANQ